MLPSTGALSDPQPLPTARALRAVSLALEVGVCAVIAGSTAAFGAVHPESYRWVWLGCVLLGGLAALHAGLAARLRSALGWRRIALDERGIWGGSREEPRRRESWSADLGRVGARAPLLLPGACFAAWALLQLVPLPPALLNVLSPGRAALEAERAAAWLPITVSTSDTARGLAFLAAALMLHVAAAAAVAASGARARLLRGIALLGLAFSIVGLVQLSQGAEKIYGVFRPLERSGSIFGPFVNRNHFAGFMLMALPAGLAVAADAFRRLPSGLARGRAWRGLVLALDTRAGAALILWTGSVLIGMAALLASQSRGGLLAFLVGLSLLTLTLARRAIPWLAALALAAALSAPAIERLQERFARTPQERLTRTLVWKDSLARSQPSRWVGTGFNTYATALNRADAWELPEAATGWAPGASPAELLGPRGGYRLQQGFAEDYWYRELHNDYLQVLIEAGVPGLLLALWAAGAVLFAARKDPWVLAALTGVLAHELVDFDLQIPALALLFVTLAAVSARTAAVESPAKPSPPSPG